jgi:outer membrane lipoprotein LolB
MLQLPYLKPNHLLKSMLRLISFISLCTLLSSCVSLQKKLSPIDTIRPISKNWSLTGKFALSNGIENASGKITYSVSNQSIHAKFKAPLGQGSWEIKQDKDNAKLLSTRHDPVYGNNAQSLISQELGWDFPWNSLSYWLRGYETSEKITTHIKSIDEIYDNGWTISYSKWVQTSNGLLPKKIKASKPPYTVKLFIYNWTLD